MKAIRRCDGKVIDVIEFSPREFIETVDQTGDGRKIYPEGQVVLLEAVDWEAFRREAAKDFVVALVSSGNGLNYQNIAYSIEMADELVKQLKDGR